MMPFLWSLLWAMTVTIVMYWEIRFRLPVLEMRKELDSPNHAYRFGFTKETYLFTVAVMACSAFFAAWCGYRAAAGGFSIFSMIKALLTCCVLACVLITDGEWMVIPNSCVLVLAGGRMILLAGERMANHGSVLSGFCNSLLTAVICLAVLMLMHWLTHGGIGLGDVKLFCGIGFLCSLTTVCYTLVLSFLSCALVSTVCLIGKRMGLKDWMPLGPFIYIGFGLAVILNIA